MKRTTLAIIAGIAFTTLTGIAGAGERQSLEQVNVNSSKVDCTPPTDLAVCAAWHEEIRRNFTSREIGMLFGAATSYPEYRTSYSKVKARYDALQGEFAATHGLSGNFASR
jgi:hypothetical protein